ncbi:energy-coupling factor transporter transmembrane component T family protein [Limibacillus halophilus]
MISLYLSGRSWLHGVPAGVKLLALVAITLVIVPLADPWAMAGALGGVLLVYASLPAAWGVTWRLLRPLLVLMAVIFALYYWSGQLQAGALVMLRILTLVLLANLVTLTTRVDEMMAALLPLFRPLKVFGLSPRRLSLMVALAIRFVPLLFERFTELAEAWRARSPRRPSWRLIAPFSVRTLTMSDQVAEALTARGGAEGFGPEPREPTE